MPDPGHDRHRAFDMAGYAGNDFAAYASRSLSSWDDLGWRALLLQRFAHAPAAGQLVLPPSTDHHLWLVTAGSGDLHVDTGDGWRRRPIGPGLVGRAVPGAPTRIRYETDEPMVTLHLHLAADRVDRMSADLGTSPPAAAVGTPDPAFVRTLLPALATAAGNGADALYAETAAAFLAAHLTAAAPGAPRPVADARIRVALAYLRENLGRPVTLAEVAATVRLSPFHFLRVFKQSTGRTPHRYLIELRIEEAKRLLGRGLTVTETAGRCGFSSPAHLSTAFLRETGVRPSRFRITRP
ncbi:AraC family transcriptional regulator [Actinoplanes sp. NBRC 14428]|uniref:AraC family transcriptional regulator n=1 Tax=Pseudosporangium ferrugineum TaxID=439699 RepID=A0A2T0SEP9_9ACTN|nr:AraC family transcriptional regulator [Pseudosporangium ferrugineum]PRY31892.1 AraC family transcriptional regulator [Pseudosporangium ferrugineum]BCJ49872.1 AraC family transcriptional regulator [Actinoplanes sp. NBRC 14428]